MVHVASGANPWQEHGGWKISFLSSLIENGMENNWMQGKLSHGHLKLLHGHLTRALVHVDESFEDLKLLSNTTYLRLAMFRS